MDNPFAGLRTFADYQQLQEEHDLKRQALLAQVAKTNEFDIDKVGQQAFIKASNGMTLSPTESAALQYIDNKTQTATFNPVTGAAEQRPSLLQRAGIALPQAQQAKNMQVGPSFAQAMRAPAQGGGGDFLADLAPQVAALPTVEGAAPVNEQGGNQWDVEYQKQLALVGNNPKARQELMTTYAKKKFDMNDQESKDATFADRMSAANPMIEKYTPAALDNSNVRLDRNLPDFIANRVVSDDYQSFNQAQRDFINAQLRKESGAAIAPSEFQNAAKQYFPQVGDSEQVLAQKKVNRDNAVSGMTRAAGPAYKPPVIAIPAASPASSGGWSIREVK